ncbi:tRNA (adenosine(37)-N6)-dimethylallyltransferase MiaA [Erysipelothrix urinaevulpis]|uniref:tRNA (adenosine(37)-N6)-dimethylallyltransferase MiaA n=1 Tax=Erysipelothrix urinaevulpis TaxID=2683717 RepID=UPI00135B21B2|nr:tRNA (adenosine(37)-N6)-dimethylallyltransferase MiaA [Erysipelothrix urinaevulpis]
MKKVIVIAGVTGSGKSSLAIELAEQYNGEIISADSVAVYEELDIGSAKPTKTEQNTVPHHLIDHAKIDEIYSVADFQKDARALIDEISRQGKIPIVVGGTGLYINALIYDYYFDEQELVAIDESLSNQELKNILEDIDPETSAKVHINNRKRLIHSVRMAKTHGKGKSEINQANKNTAYYNACVFFLEGEREKLYERMNKRVETMFELGLLKEVEDLNQRYDKLWTYQSVNSIGYREFNEYFLGNRTLEEVKELIKRNTRRLAKRQITWFKHQTPCHFVDIYDQKFKYNIEKKIDEFLKD